MQTHPPPPTPGDLIEIEVNLGVVSHLLGTKCYFWTAYLEAGNRVRVDRTQLKSINTKLCLVVPRPGELARRMKAEREISLTKVPKCPKRDPIHNLKVIGKKYSRNGRWTPFLE